MPLTTLTCRLGLALLAAAPSAPAPFPATPVETLAGRKLDVARDIAPGLAILVIGFTKASRAQTSEWSRRLEPALLDSAGAQVYQVAVLEDVPGIFRRYVAGRIRAAVPENMHSRFLLALEGAAAWKRLADFGEKDDAYVLLVRDGEVRWRGAGNPTPARYERLVEALTGGVRFDAERLRTGRFAYRIRKDDKEVARFTITIQRRPDGTFRFTGEATGFHQRWESIATRFFEPIAAALDLQRSNGEKVAMTLSYGNRRVTGSATTSNRKGAPAPEVRAIDAGLPNDTVDQRIDWAAALSAPLETGTTFRFHVYDPATGVSPVSASVGPPESVAVPAGTFDTTRVVYRIEKSNGTESYEVLASRDAHRMMVREDFPDGTVTELLEVSENGTPFTPTLSRGERGRSGN